MNKRNYDFDSFLDLTGQEQTCSLNDAIDYASYLGYEIVIFGVMSNYYDVPFNTQIKKDNPLLTNEQAEGL